MPSKQLPTDYELEELLKLVNSSKDDPHVYGDLEPNDIVLFLSTFEIQPGQNLVLHKLIYQLYKLWSKQPLNHQHFSIEMAKFILPKDVDNRHYYLINSSAFKLSAKSYQLIAAKTIDKTKSKNYRRHFDAFLKHYDLKPGKCWLESYLIYYLYDLWTYKKKTHSAKSSSTDSPSCISNTNVGLKVKWSGTPWTSLS
jgi:hypothetical protein